MSLTTTIDLLRHGHCQGGEIFRGARDVDLSQEGEQQMREKLSLSLTKSWDLVISSPLKRCQVIAKQFSTEKNIPLIVENDLREMHFGDWDGQQIADIQKTQSELFSLWQQDPNTATPPNGEPLADVQKRVASVWKEITNTHKGKQILCITHGGVIRVLLGQILDLPSTKLNALNIPYACLSRLNIYHLPEQHFTQLHAHNLERHE